MGEVWAQGGDVGGGVKDEVVGAAGAVGVANAEEGCPLGGDKLGREAEPVVGGGEWVRGAVGSVSVEETRVREPENPRRRSCSEETRLSGPLSS